MNTEVLRKIGLTENEIKIYLYLLKAGEKSAYAISKDTGIYRVHVYDKLEQLAVKGLVSHVFKGAKKFFKAAQPSKLRDYVEEQQRDLEENVKDVDKLMPELEAMTELPREDTYVEVFKGREGLKYFLRDVIKTGSEVLITGLDDKKYDEVLPVFMKQYFRDLRLKNIKERVINIKAEGFKFEDATTTEYRFLEEGEFNPTNTFVYRDKVVIVTWGEPVTAVMMKNKNLAETYRRNFERLWGLAK